MVFAADVAVVVVVAADVADAVAVVAAVIVVGVVVADLTFCLLYTSPSPRDQRGSRMPSSA